jgi:hypothetical protein
MIRAASSILPRSRSIRPHTPLSRNAVRAPITFHSGPAVKILQAEREWRRPGRPAHLIRELAAMCRSLPTAMIRGSLMNRVRAGDYPAWPGNPHIIGQWVNSCNAGRSRPS